MRKGRDRMLPVLLLLRSIGATGAVANAVTNAMQATAPTIGCGTRFSKTGHADLIPNTNSSAFDDYNVAHPFVAEVSGAWRLYYDGGPTSGMHSGHEYDFYQLGMATSTGGAGGPWVREGSALLPLIHGADDHHGNPTLLRDDSNRVVREGGLFHMIYCGDKNYSLFRAVSSDGVAWTKVDGGPFWASGYAPSVLRVDGMLHLFYVEAGSPDAPHSNWSIAVARGRDWGSLERVGTALVTNTQAWENQRVFYPYVLHERDGRGWTMAYSAYANRSIIGLPPKGTSGTLAAATGVAHSADGVTWTKCASNPVLTPTLGSNYDSIFTTSPSVVTVNAAGDPVAAPLLYYGGRIDFPEGVKQHKYYSLAHAAAANT